MIFEERLNEALKTIYEAQEIQKHQYDHQIVAAFKSARQDSQLGTLGGKIKDFMLYHEGGSPHRIIFKLEHKQFLDINDYAFDVYFDLFVRDSKLTIQTNSDRSRIGKMRKMRWMLPTKSLSIEDFAKLIINEVIKVIEADQSKESKEFKDKYTHGQGAGYPG